MIKKINSFIEIKAIFLLVFFASLENLYAESGKDAPIIQPGAPGMPSKMLDSSEATNIANTS